MSPAMSWAERRKIAEQATDNRVPLEPMVYSFVVRELPKAEEKNGWPNYTINPSVEDGPRKNARVWHTFYTTEKPNGMRMFYENMAVFGLTPEFFDAGPSDEEIVHALHGKRFTAEVYNEEWNGKVRQRLRKFAAPVAPSAAAGPGAPAGPGLPTVPAAPVTAAAPVAPAAPAAPAAPPSPWGSTVAAPPQMPI